MTSIKSVVTNQVLQNQPISTHVHSADQNISDPKSEGSEDGPESHEEEEGVHINAQREHSCSACVDNVEQPLIWNNQRGRRKGKS